MIQTIKKGISAFFILFLLLALGAPAAQAASPGDDFVAAINAAAPGSTVTLAESIDLSAPITIAKEISVDLNGFTINASLPSGANSLFVVENGGKLTLSNGYIMSANFTGRAIEGKAGAVITLNEVNIGDFSSTGYGGAISISSGTLSVTGGALGMYTDDYHGNSAVSGGAVYAYESNVSLKDVDIFGNISTGSDYYIGGGGVLIEAGSLSTTAKAVIDDCYFFNNESYACGGAIYVEEACNADILNCEIANCTAWSRVSGKPSYGGAIYCRLPGKVNITGNSISKCISLGNGGGIGIITASGLIESYVVLDGNEITECESGGRGGGLFLVQDTAATGTSIVLKSGVISKNKAHWGAGIDYTGKSMAPLYLQNVIIAGNTAQRGGGIWACPTSNTTIYTSMGAAIYGNTAVGAATGLNAGPAKGDEVQYEGLDSTDWVATEGNYPVSNSTSASISRRALGGGLMAWYSDAPNHRYTPGDAQADPSLYENTQYTFSLHGELSEEMKALAMAEGKLLITNNVCTGTYGGGIASNSPIVIGVNEDITVKVKKLWTAADHPSSVLVDLYRVDAEGSRVKLDSGVELNAGNDWSATFTSLPGVYLDGNGQQQAYTYEVVEQGIEGWSASADKTTDGRTINITLTNTPVNREVGSLRVSKIAVGGSGQEEYSFTVVLDDSSINGRYGDMDFVNGTAVFTLRSGESKTAEGLPNGMGYRVSELALAGAMVTVNGIPGYGANGTILTGATAEAAFTNYLNGGSADSSDSIHVSKVWDDGNSSSRPASVTAVLYRNGQEYSRVVLSAENAWSYSWTGLESGYIYTVAEADIPAGYQASVSQSGNSFVITNMAIRMLLPQTGSVSLLGFALLSLGMAIGFASKRRSR